jgi:8-amino-7-oxononanoate synthase
MKEDFLDKKLQQRKEEDALRQLKTTAELVDFCSNDYLGLAQQLQAQPGLAHGATGSRLLAGNYSLIETTEAALARFHQSATALIFNSGYDANVGLLSCVAQRGDTILYDYLSHASIRDGIRLSFAQSHSFLHNNLTDLEKKLQQATGTVFVVTESVFSMDGDLAPLADISRLCQHYHAHLIVDEAHATGVMGPNGAGLVQQLQLHDACFARVHTFGKAVGCHGAAVLGSAALRNYLINFSRAFIYTTALPPASIAVVQQAYQLFPLMNEERTHLQRLIQLFQQTSIRYQKLISPSPIQAVVVPGNAAVKQVAQQLQQNGFDVRPILYPTVPKGAERLRIVLHAFNTTAQLQQLLALLQ